MVDTTFFGDYYWCVKVPFSISPDGEIYLMADEVGTDPTGSLWLKRANGQVNLLLASGQWYAVFQAMIENGEPVAVDYWLGEVTEEEEPGDGI